MKALSDSFEDQVHVGCMLLVTVAKIPSGNRSSSVTKSISGPYRVHCNCFQLDQHDKIKKQNLC